MNVTFYRYTFLRKKNAKPKISYMTDGRRLVNGEPLICERPKHLWRDLFVRAFTLRIKTISDTYDDESTEPTVELKGMHLLRVHDDIDSIVGISNQNTTVESDDDEADSESSLVLSSTSMASLEKLDRIERHLSNHVEMMNKRRSRSLDALRNLDARQKRELHARANNWSISTNH